jgi:phosphoribosylaminoimidazolecarboxamide formyltransferase/IMP cyclohydrolase
LDTDIAQMEQHQIPDIDLVIVDLYPFEETLAKGATEEEIIEKIDIGGISLIRAAAKNFNDVLIVSSRNDYQELEKLLDEKQGYSELSDRRQLAAKGFANSSHYDTAIFNYFNAQEHLSQFRQSYQQSSPLRYGENPHQKGIFYGDLNALFDKIHGKELSYNNLLDVDAALNLIGDFTEPTFAIIKHNNACGLASRPTILAAYLDALAGDPVSAFGGILVANETIDDATAVEINKLFCEVVIAPAYDAKGLDLQNTSERCHCTGKGLAYGDGF